MPTTSAASSDSRQAIRSVSSTAPSPYQQRATALLVKVVEELIAPGPEARDVHRGRLPRLDHALAVQLEALELDRHRGPVGDLEADAGAGGRLDLGRRESRLLDRERDRPVLRCHPSGNPQQEGEGDGE